MGAAVIDQVITRYMGESSSIEAASKRASASVREFGHTQENVFHNLKGTFGRGSTLVETLHLFSGAGPILGIGLLAREFSHLGHSIEEAVDKGENFFKGFIEGLPLIGSLVSGLDAIGKAITHSHIDKETEKLRMEWEKIDEAVSDATEKIDRFTSDMPKISPERQALIDAEDKVRSAGGDERKRALAMVEIRAAQEKLNYAEFTERYGKQAMADVEEQWRRDKAAMTERENEDKESFNRQKQYAAELARDGEDEFKRMSGLADRFGDALQTPLQKAVEAASEAAELLRGGIIDESEFNAFTRKTARGLVKSFSPAFPQAALLGSQEAIANSATDREALNLEKMQTAWLEKIANYLRQQANQTELVYGGPN